MEKLTPLQSLVLLLLGALGVCGWFYGIHWKRVAEGDLFTNDEKMMIRLQDQIQSLSQQNEALQQRIASLTEQPEPESGDAPKATINPAPLLPAPPQKIETH